MLRTLVAASHLAISLLAGAGAAIGSEASNSRDSGIRLVDVAEEVGITLVNVSGEKRKDYIVETVGNGAALVDTDNDGHLDVVITNGSRLVNVKPRGDPMVALYRNLGNGRFADITADSGLGAIGWGMGVCVADYDNDGDEDIYITAFGPNVLYQNEGNSTFTDVTRYAGVGDPRWGTNCAFGDYDRDGDLDLYVANFVVFDEHTVRTPSCKFKGEDVMCGPDEYPGSPDLLYRNNGDGTFSDVTERAGINAPGHNGFGVIFADLDNDGWPDIYVANDSDPNDLYRNNGDGTFSNIGMISGAALSEAGQTQGGMGVDIGDYDNDGWLDIFVTNWVNDYNTLYRNEGGDYMPDFTHAAGLGVGALPFSGWGTAFVDLDNDGHRDLFVANGHTYSQAQPQRKQVFYNMGDGRFREITEQIGGDLLVEKSSRGAAFGDYDNDGDVDILVVNLDDRPTLLRNDTENGNYWLKLRLVGTASNRSAVGARVEIRIADDRQIDEVRSGGSYLSSNDPRLHFGLGTSTRVDRLEIRWPSGKVEAFENLAANQILTIREGDGVVAKVPSAKMP